MHDVKGTGRNRKDSFDFGSLTLRCVQPSDKQRLEALRIEAFRNAKNTSLIDDTPLRWNQVEEKHLCLVVENEAGEIVSTIRAVKIEDTATFLHWSNIIAGPEIQFPLLYLKNGATAVAYRRLGLNIILKMVLIHQCLESNVQCMVNTINEGTSRIKLIESMGFRFSKPKLRKRDVGNSPFIFRTPLTMGLLHRPDFHKFLGGGESGIDKAWQAIGKEPASLDHISAYMEGIIGK